VSLLAGVVFVAVISTETVRAAHSGFGPVPATVSGSGARSRSMLSLVSRPRTASSPSRYVHSTEKQTLKPLKFISNIHFAQMKIKLLTTTDNLKKDEREDKIQIARSFEKTKNIMFQYSLNIISKIKINYQFSIDF
jgi:hypothetical protein